MSVSEHPGAMIRLRAAIGLIKPELPFTAGACVVLGEIMALGGIPDLSLVVLGFLVGFSLSASAMVSNDYFDLEVDRINAPERPLPSGRATVRTVLWLTAFFTVLGLGVAAYLGPLSLLLSAITWTVGLMYNWRFKSTGLPGNLMVAFSVAMTFLYGGAVVGGIGSGLVWTFSVLAFLFDLAEEIANGVNDAEGDALRSSRSIARVRGRKAALRISFALFLTVVAISLLPYAAGWLGLTYLIPVLIVDAVVLYLAIELCFRENAPEEGGRLTRYLYLTMMCMVLAVILGSVL